MSHTAEFTIFEDDDQTVTLAYNGYSNEVQYCVIVTTEQITGEEAISYEWPIPKSVAKQIAKFIEVNEDDY